jgi:hypothetical protein
LIDEKEYKNLHLIRKIRNHFAHNLQATFDDPEVKSWCNMLDASGFLPRATETATKKFNTLSTFLAVTLANRPYMAVGRRIGEEGWQDRVRKHLMKMKKVIRAGS